MNHSEIVSFLWGVAVHWVATREGATSSDTAVAQTYAWNDRKKRFSPRQIGLALDLLVKKGWVGPAMVESTA